MLQRTAPFLAGLLAGFLFSGVLWLLTARPRGEPVLLLPPPSPAPLRVHVAGAVAQPGVYALPAGSIVQEAIDAAGGLLPEAVPETLNLAAPLADGQQVYVNALPSEPALPEGAAPNLSGDRIRLNTATAPELETLPGIGPALAQAIVEYRETRGPFRSLEDILEVPGIGPAKLAQIRDLVIVP